MLKQSPLTASGDFDEASTPTGATRLTSEPSSGKVGSRSRHIEDREIRIEKAPDVMSGAVFSEEFEEARLV